MQSQTKMSGEEVGSQLNTLQPLRHVGVCAQGYRDLIRNGSVAFSVPINHPCPHFPSLSLLSHLFFSFHLFCYFISICYTCCLPQCLCTGYLWVTHLHQVTNNTSWTSCPINILQHHHHRFHDVIVSVETKLGIRVRFTLHHDHIFIFPIRLPENTPWIISCMFIVWLKL